jgi:hypothetical protein
MKTPINSNGYNLDSVQTNEVCRTLVTLCAQFSTTARAKLMLWEARRGRKEASRSFLEARGAPEELLDANQACEEDATDSTNPCRFEVS